MKKDPDKLWPLLPQPPHVPVPETTLSAIRSAYDQGQYMDAWQLAQPLGDLRSWQGTRARVLAARLATRLSGDRLSRWLNLSTWRADPLDAEALLFRAYDAFATHGPLWVWEQTENLPRLSGLSTELHADLLALRARVAFSYRDFAQAWPLLHQAKELAPDHAWLHCEIASCYAAEHKPELALSAVEEALRMNPRLRPAIQMRAAFLLELGQMDDALDLLERARSELQSAEVTGMLVGLRRELDDADAMLSLLDDWQHLSPLAPHSSQHWLAARRCDAYCLLKRWEDARATAAFIPLETEATEEDGADYYPRLAARLAAGSADQAKRVRLTVPKLLQDHRTCGPTTLAMLCGYWAYQTSKEQIADAICYDGTYDHSERQWCLDEGLGVREFKLTWDAAVLLLDARVPFALATVEPTSAHLQAVVGYDSVRETLFIQDPGSLVYREVIAQEFLKQYEMNGPRCMAVVPEKDAEWLQSLPLPEAVLYDETFVLQRALSLFQRQLAAEAYERLQQRAPGHRLVWLAQLALADFDGDSVSARAAVEGLLLLFPKNPRPQLRQLLYLREQGRRADRLALLRERVKGKSAHIAFWRELAYELGEDARDKREVWHWLRKCHRCAPTDDGVLSVMAAQWWGEGQRQRALMAWRFAASAADKSESRAMQWASAMRSSGQREEAISWLRQRTESLGKKDSRAWITLAHVLDEQQRTEESLAVFEQALLLHPKDGPLLLAASRMQLRVGNTTAAEELLHRAKPLTSFGDWHRALAQLKTKQGLTAESRTAWEEVQQREPLAMDAHEALTYLIASQEGQSAARARLEDFGQRFPQHFGLSRLRIEWCRNATPQESESVIRQTLEQHPTNAWVWRELALNLAQQQRMDEAIRAAQEAAVLEPDSPQSHGVLASVLANTERTEEARAAARQALQRSVDYTPAIHTLLESAPHLSAKRQELDFIRSEMIRQSIGTEVLHTYRDVAFGLIDPAELLAQLQEVQAARPDLWAAHSVVTAQQLDSGQLDAALDGAKGAVAAFPLLADAWRDLAIAHRRRSEMPQALEAAVHAVSLSPDSSACWRLLADVQEDHGELAESLSTLRQAHARLPLDYAIHAMLCGLLWRQGAQAEAFQEVLALAQRESTQTWAWDHAQEWGAALGKREAVVDAARELTQHRPGESSSWTILAHVLPRQLVEERLAALDRCISIAPREPDAYDLKAMLLASQGRLTEARQVLDPPVFKGHPPHNLRGRSAWLLHEEGRTREAISTMEKVLQEQPSYLWGWHHLAEWANEARLYDKAREAARNLVRLAPESASALASAGETEQRAGNDSAAADFYTRSLRAYPGEGWVMDALCRIHWTARQLPALAAACELGHTGPALWVARAYRVLLLAGQKELDSACFALAQAAECPFHLGTLPRYFAQELHSLKMTERAQHVLQQSSTEGRLGVSWACLLVELECAQSHWQVWQHFSGWILRFGEQAVEPIACYLDALGDARAAGPELTELLAAQRSYLHTQTTLYGKVGYALVNSKRYMDAMNWLKQCQQRQDVEGWMVANASLAQWEQGHYLAAAEISSVVLQRELRDNTWNWHVAMATYGHAFQGELAAAQAALSQYSNPAEDMPLLYRWALELGRSQVRVRNAATSTRKKIFSKERAQLRELAKKWCVEAPDLLALHTAALEAMSRHAHTQLWPWQRSLRGFHLPMNSTLLWVLAGAALLKLVLLFLKLWYRE